MRRIFVGDKFRLHYVATLSAELYRFHVLYGPVSTLSANDEIRNRGDPEKKTKSRCNDVLRSRMTASPSLTAPSSEVDAYRDHREAKAKR